jgi:carbon storage regulator
MLVLTRRIGEAIVLGKDVTIRVVQVDGGRVRLGISAPEGVAVNRAEVLRRLAEWAEPDTILEVDLPDPR